MHDNPHYHSKFTTNRSNHKPFCAFATFFVRSAILTPIFAFSLPNLSDEEGKECKCPGLIYVYRNCRAGSAGGVGCAGGGEIVAS